MFDVHLRRPLVPVGTGDCCAPKLVAHAIRLVSVLLSYMVVGALLFFLLFVCLFFCVFVFSSKGVPIS
jgi:hypothetical protein